MLFFYLSFLSFFTVENDTRSYLFILSSLLEAIFIYALYEQSKRILLKFFAIILSVIYISQIYSIYKTGGLLSPLAIQNAQTATTTTMTFTGLYVLLILLMFVLILTHSGYLSTFFKLKINKYVIGFLVIAPYPFTTTPDNINIRYMDAPIRSFVKTISHSALGTDSKVDINPSVLSEIRKSHFYQNQNNHLRIEKKNILVVFSEGFSARWIYEYSGQYPELTPSLNSIYKRSYVIDNYYNHTAATFRGLRGQILSVFQKSGGWSHFKTGLAQKAEELNVKFVFNTPIQALKRNGYKNYFFLSQENKLNEMLETMEFDQVYGRDALSESFQKKDGEQIANLSDEQLFDGVLTTLQEKNSKNEKFFAAVYNFDTHNGLDSNLKFKDYNNEVLNRLHKFDLVFGKFIKKFENSPLFDNTILIFTSDHSTFPGKSAKEADPTIPNVFVDKIPFMFFGKNIGHDIYNSDGATSITFMPTLFDVFGLRNEPNMILGCSLFEKCITRSLGAIDKFFFKIQDDKIIEITKTADYGSHIRLIEISYAISDFE